METPETQEDYWELMRISETKGDDDTRKIFGTHEILDTNKD